MPTVEISKDLANFFLRYCTEKEKRLREKGIYSSADIWRSKKMQIEEAIKESETEYEIIPETIILNRRSKL